MTGVGRAVGRGRARRQVLDASLIVMGHWGVSQVGAECTLPALACYGVPNTLPHIRRLIADAGFGQPSRTETVLVAPCEALLHHDLAAVSVDRTLGLLGARLMITREGTELAFIEVCDHSSAMARSSTAARWADVGNLVVRPDHDLAVTTRLLLAAAADWLLLGGITRLVHYWANDVDSPSTLAQLRRLGFRELVVNERGFRRAI